MEHLILLSALVTMAQFSYLFALALPATAGRRSVQAQSTCPDKCLCVMDTPKPRVYCNYRQLDAIPRTLPEATVMLYLQLNNLQEIPQNVFQHLENLAFVTISNNNIQSLPATTFEHNSKLTTIDLKNNAITSIPPHAFDSQVELVSLNLRFNKIGSIPGLAFRNLHQLQTLILFNNLISNVDKDAFYGLEELTHLYLMNNQIASLPDNVFAPLKNLKELHLEGNPMECCRVQSALKSLPKQMATLKGSCKWAGDQQMDLVDIHQLICPVVVG